MLDGGPLFGIEALQGIEHAFGSIGSDDGPGKDPAGAGREPAFGAAAGTIASMCRSIKRLRDGDVPATDPEIREAALQFVRKVSGYRAPSKRNEAAFDEAVNEVTEASRRLIAAVTRA